MGVVEEWIFESDEEANAFIFKQVSIPGNQPSGAKQIGKFIELSLYQDLWKTINTYIGNITSGQSQTEILNGVYNTIDEWVTKKAPEVDTAFEALFKRGFAAGVVSGGGALKTEDKNAMEILKQGKYRIGERIVQFASDTVDRFSDVITKSFTPEGTFSLEALTKDMSEIVPATRGSLERIARTETGQVSQIGRLWAWENDSDRYFFKYRWQSTPDNKRREMKKMRSAGNPYSYDECKYLFSHNEQRLPNGVWQQGSINCRCSISRTTSDEEVKGNRFVGQEANFRKTMEIDF